MSGPGRRSAICRWHSPKRDRFVTDVRSGEIVQPEVKGFSTVLPRGATIFRTYEAVIRRAINRVNGKTARKVADVVQVFSQGDTVRYEEWEAHFRPPWERPTVYAFRTLAGWSTPLHVSQTVVFKTEPHNLEIGAAQIGRIKTSGGRTVAGEVRAPQDPDLELFPLSPYQAPDGLQLENYVSGYLEAVAADLREDEDFLEAAERLPGIIRDEYAGFLAGEGELYVEIKPTRARVGPDEDAFFTVDVHVERPGPMMLVICARSPDIEGLAISDLLPIEGVG